jgi:hypothetical protein
MVVPRRLLQVTGDDKSCLTSVFPKERRERKARGLGIILA